MGPTAASDVQSTTPELPPQTEEDDLNDNDGEEIEEDEEQDSENGEEPNSEDGGDHEGDQGSEDVDFTTTRSPSSAITTVRPSPQGDGTSDKGGDGASDRGGAGGDNPYYRPH